MITLEYFNGAEWVEVDKWYNESLCWVSLGQDNYNYRTVDETGKVLNVSTLKNRLIFSPQTKNKPP